MEFKVIRAYDPAMDREAMKADGVWELFLENRDVKLITYDEENGGEKAAMVFHCRTLTRQQRRELDGLLPERKREHAFRVGVVSVENMLYPDKGIRAWSRKDVAKPMKDMELDLFAENDIQHVGEVIRAYSFCSPDRLPYVPLLATCLDELIAAGLAFQRRRAAQMRERAALSESGSSNLEAPPPTILISSAAGEKPGGATATGSGESKTPHS